MLFMRFLVVEFPLIPEFALIFISFAPLVILQALLISFLIALLPISAIVFPFLLTLPLAFFPMSQVFFSFLLTLLFLAVLLLTQFLLLALSALYRLFLNTLF